MGKDYRPRKNYYFCLLFLSKRRNQWQTSLNKKSLLEQIFCLIKMSFRNHLLLCAATVVISCRTNLLIQNLILANIKLIFWLVKTILSYFFQTLLLPKITFTSSENIFFNDYFILASENSFSVQWKQYAFVRSIFLSLETMTEIRGESVLTENYFPVRGNHFLLFFPEDAVFLVEAYFSTNSSFQLLEKDFLFSGNHLLHLRLLSYQPEPSLTCVKTIF